MLCALEGDLKTREPELYALLRQESLLLGNYPEAGGFSH